MSKESNWSNKDVAKMLLHIIEGILDGTIDVVLYKASRTTESSQADKSFYIEYAQKIKKESKE